MAMVLIIGYGSNVRGDDAVGQVLVDALRVRLPDADIIATTQLMPELAETISRADTVFFVDASVSLEPGAVACEAVCPESGDSTFTHSVTPQTLLAAAKELYGTAPAASLISVGAHSFAYSTTLSPTLHDALPALLDTVHQVIERMLRPHGGIARAESKQRGCQVER